jgi:hypothetical protein
MIISTGQGSFPPFTDNKALQLEKALGCIVVIEGRFTETKFIHHSKQDAGIIVRDLGVVMEDNFSHL